MSNSFYVNCFHNRWVVCGRTGFRLRQKWRKMVRNFSSYSFSKLNFCHRYIFVTLIAVISSKLDKIWRIYKCSNINRNNEQLKTTFSRRKITCPEHIINIWRRLLKTFRSNVPLDNTSSSGYRFSNRIHILWVDLHTSHDIQRRKCLIKWYFNRNFHFCT